MRHNALRRLRVVKSVVLYFLGLGYVVGFTSLFSASLGDPHSPFSTVALMIGPFWNAIMLVLPTVVLAALGVRYYQFLLTLVSYDVVAFFTWYHLTGEWKSDMAEGAMPIVAAIMLVALIVQVPIGVTVSYFAQRIRHRATGHMDTHIKVPAWVVVTSIILTLLVVSIPVVLFVRVTWPYNFVAKAVYWARPTPPPLQHTVRAVRYRPEALAVGEKHTLFVSSDGPNAIVAYRVLPDGKLVLWHVLYGAHTGIKDPLGIALDTNNRLYVSNYDTNSIDRFEADDSEDVAPAAVIAGSRTLLDHPADIQVDNSGFLYVLQGVFTGEILVFAPGASGDVKPLRVISGPQTLLADSGPMRVDGEGKIFVGNYGSIGDGSANVNYVTVFAKSATGDVEPSTVLNIRDQGRLFAVDDAERLILVASDSEILAFAQPYSERNETSLGFIDSREYPQDIAARGKFLYFTDLHNAEIAVYPLLSSMNK